MTVSTTIVDVEFPGNGATAEWSIPFPVLSASDLDVALVQDSTGVEQPQLLTTHYTITLLSSGALLRMIVPHAAGYTLRVKSAIELKQPDTLRALGRYNPGTVERMFDRATVLLQQLARDTMTREAIVELLESYAALPADATVRSDLALFAAGKGANMMGWKRSVTGASQRTAAELFGHQVRHINEFKVNDSDATTSAVLQAAINSFGVEGGILDINEADILLSTTIWVKYPVLIRCRGRGEISTNSNGTGGGLTTFNWAGADNGVMFYFGARAMASVQAASTSGELLIGGGLTGAVLVGRSGPGVGAAVGIWACSTENLEIDVKAYSLKTDGVVLDGGNAVVGKHNRVRVAMTWGVDTAFAGMHGIRLRAYNGWTATQSDLWVEGLANHGDHIRCEDTDNNRIWSCHGSMQPGGTGKGIAFRNGTGVLPARSNVVFYAACHIHAESQTLGNIVHSHNSEAGNITCDAGAILHYAAVDYVDGGLFQTNRYRMYDSRWVPAKDWASVSGGADGVAALLYPSKDMAKSGTPSVAYLMPAPLDWNDGNILTIVPFFACDSAVAGNVRLNIKISTITVGSENLATPEQVESFTVTPSSSAYVPLNTPCSLAAPKGYTRGQMIAVVIERDQAHAADTKAATVKFLGANIVYQCAGPNSGGSGTYQLPSMGS